MCGLIGVISRKGGEDTKEAVLEQYERQYNRGVKGFGLIEVNKSSYRVRRATEPVKALLDIARSESNILLFHHRQPTSTDNTLEQTHPIFVSCKELEHDYLVQHNGVIYNSDERKTEHEKLGYVYTTFNEEAVGTYHSRKFNDSESFAIDLARVIEGKDEKIKSRGAAAFFVLQMDKKTGVPLKILWGRNERNPLVIAFFKSTIAIASDLNIGDEVKEGILFSVNVKDIFGTKKKVRSLVQEKPIAWEEIEVTKPIVPTVVANNKYNWNEHTVQATKTAVGFIQPPAAKENTGPDDEEEAQTSLREAAFERMWDRDMLEIGAEIWPFYEELAYDDVQESEIDIIVTKIKDLLLERAEKSKKAKDWFDRQETEEAYRERDEEEWNKTLSIANKILEDDAPSNLPVEGSVSHLLELPAKAEISHVSQPRIHTHYPRTE